MTRRNPFPGVGNQPSIDRHGKPRWRLRRTVKGVKIDTYLPGPYGSTAFRAAYEAAVSGGATVQSNRRADPYTFDWLIERYLVSPRFQNISAGYKRNLSLEIERFRRDYGKGDFRSLTADQVERIIAKKRDTPASANKLLKLIKRLCRYAVKKAWLDRDPTIGVEPYAMNPDGYYTWTEADIGRFEDHHGAESKAVLAMRLMLRTGAARQDAARMGWQNIKGERIEYRRHKTGQEVSLKLAYMPELADVIDLVPRHALLFVTHGKGRGYSPAAFGNWFKDQCRAAGLPKRAAAHGLRKAGATRLANAGATEFEVMAFLGHKTPDEARTYVKAADRQRLADSALEKALNVSNPVERLDNHRSKQLKGKEK